MSFAKSLSGVALAIVLLQGAMGNPVSKTVSEYGSSPTPTSTTVDYEGKWDACDNTPAPYGCPSSSSSSSTTACPSICADYINECGMMYGGCFPDPQCTGGTAWPTFVKPTCTTVTASPTSSACPTICADYINDCGQMYGGCFPDPQCTGGTAFPTFSKPPCPTTTSAPTITTVPGSTTTCSTLICSDFINSCGRIEGVCLLDPNCTANGVFPTTYSLGPCTTTTETCNTICVDKVNSCGQKYGGCFPDPTCTGGTAWPTFSSPACPTGTGVTSASVTTVTPPVSPSTTLETDTVTSYASIAPDTVTVTSTSQTVIVPPSPVAAIAVNGTSTTGASPTVSESAPQSVFTGEAVRNRVGCGIAAVIVAVGVAFL